MSLQAEKERLQRLMEAIRMLEQLDGEQLDAVRQVLLSDKSDMEACPQCGQMFKRAGMKRHITMTHTRARQES